MTDNPFLIYDDIFDSREKAVGILIQFFPDEMVKVNTIIDAFNAGIMGAFKETSVIDDDLIFRFVTTLVNDFGITYQWSKWAVEYWVEKYGNQVLHKSMHASFAEQTSLENEKARAGSYHTEKFFNISFSLSNYYEELEGTNDELRIYNYINEETHTCFSISRYDHYYESDEKLEEAFRRIISPIGDSLGDKEFKIVGEDEHRIDGMFGRFFAFTAVSSDDISTCGCIHTFFNDDDDEIYVSAYWQYDGYDQEYFYGYIDIVESIRVHPENNSSFNIGGQAEAKGSSMKDDQIPLEGKLPSPVPDIDTTKDGYVQVKHYDMIISLPPYFERLDENENHKMFRHVSEAGSIVFLMRGTDMTKNISAAEDLFSIIADAAVDSMGECGYIEEETECRVDGMLGRTYQFSYEIDDEPYVGLLTLFFDVFDGSIYHISYNRKERFDENSINVFTEMIQSIQVQDGRPESWNSQNTLSNKSKRIDELKNGDELPEAFVDIDMKRFQSIGIKEINCKVARDYNCDGLVELKVLGTFSGKIKDDAVLFFMVFNNEGEMIGAAHDVELSTYDKERTSFSTWIYVPEWEKINNIKIQCATGYFFSET